jgi:uncharacterized damage-inducible protein DinB
MESLAELINAYLAGPAALRRTLTGMTAEQLQARPIPGKWSTLEVLCHLADFEPIYADRMKRIIAEDQPPLIAADERRFAAALAYHQRDPEEELLLIERTRSQMARILSTLSPAVLSRVGIHSERGPLTLEQVLRSAIQHIPHHLQFVREKKRALGLPEA